jgi:hypothetical protein
MNTILTEEFNGEWVIYIANGNQALAHCKRVLANWNRCVDQSVDQVLDDSICILVNGSRVLAEGDRSLAKDSGKLRKIR